MDISVKLKEELILLLTNVPNKKVGICNNIYEQLKEKYDIITATAGKEFLKKTFVKLGYDEDFPVEYHILKNKSEAKIEFYEGGLKWNSKKSIYCQFRLELLKELITVL